MRIEQIAPFPYHQIENVFKTYPSAQICWAQEEHRNQGPYTYVKERLDVLLRRAGVKPRVRYIGRHISGSTAVGSLNTHKLQLAELLEDAFK